MPAAVLAAVWLLAGACGSGGLGGDAVLAEGRAGATAPRPEPTTTTTAAVPSTTRAAPRATTFTPKAPPAPTATSPSGSGSPVSALAPPAPGTYRYATRGQSTLGTTVLRFPEVTTLVVDPAQGTRQRAVRDLRNGGSGPLFEYVLEYRPDGIYLVSLSATVALLVFSQREELRPPSPVLLLPTGATAGTSREIDVPTAAGNAARLVIEVSSATVVRLLATVAGQLDSRIDLRLRLNPSTRLWVQESLVAEATAPTGEVAFRSEYTATLVG